MLLLCLCERNKLSLAVNRIFMASGIWMIMQRAGARTKPSRLLFLWRCCISFGIGNEAEMPDTFSLGRSHGTTGKCARPNRLSRTGI